MSDPLSNAITSPDLLPWIGLDIGGANLKGAHTSGWANSVSFPLWKAPHALSGAITHLLNEAPAFSGVAVTMTGELADCFPTRAQGVALILEQVTAVIPAAMIRVYGVDAKWYSVTKAVRAPWTVAASNWYALAQFIGRSHPEGVSLLIDIGSTTTDIIPLVDGQIGIVACNDSQRLQCGALVYTGIERSNVAAISRKVPLFGRLCPTMNEQFATARDVHIWLGDLPEEPECLQTSDGRPATREAARFRLARTVGEDGSTLADGDVDEIARAVRSDQVKMLVQGINEVLLESASLQDCQVKLPKKRKGAGASGDASRSIRAMKPDRVIVCGHGGFLLEDAIQQLQWNIPVVKLAEEVGPDVSRCAPAYAVAALAQQSSFQALGFA